MEANEPSPDSPRPPRRKRYRGRHPRGFAEKYKEHAGDPATLEKVLASGKTPAGSHRPVMVEEVLAALAPRPGERLVDATLGHGGHAELILPRLLPGGTLLGLDQDPVQLPRTGQRLGQLGFGEDVFVARRSNFAGLPSTLAALGWDGIDGLLLDLGVSSMQIDDPERGFSYKHDGPLDMRMNPRRGLSAAAWLERADPSTLERVLTSNADEPFAARLSRALAARRFASSFELSQAIREVVPEPAHDDTIPRVFQALRVEVNDEFGALDTLLRFLPECLHPGARVVAISFHSGEDRRIKKCFASGRKDGLFQTNSESPLRCSLEERLANPRSRSAKLRYAIRS